MNMSWTGNKERKNNGRGVNMPIRIAQILHRLGFCVTYDADKRKMRIYRDK